MALSLVIASRKLHPYFQAHAIMALVIASRKLHPYFQAHAIMVMTDQPIKKAMNKLDVVGNLIQWVVELNQFDIKYKPRTAIEAQILVNFIVELTLPTDEEEKKNKIWTINTNGLSIKDPNIPRKRYFEICCQSPIFNNK